MITKILMIVAYLLIAPVAGCIFEGLGRMLSAVLEGRAGATLLQPYYDVRKLLEKDSMSPSPHQDLYLLIHMIFTLAAGGVFFAGGDLMLVVVLQITATAFSVTAAYSSGSPYSVLGARRKMLMMMACQPMIIATAVGFYIYKDTFGVRELAGSGGMALLPMAGLFLGFIYIMTIKLEAAPFDLGASGSGIHELVSGTETEYTGRTLGVMKMMGWYERVTMFGILFLFLSNGRVTGYIVGILVCAAVYFLQVIGGGVLSRVKPDFALRSAWVITIALGIVNLFVLQFVIEGV